MASTLLLKSVKALERLLLGRLVRKSKANYRSRLRALARGLWSAELTRFEFVDGMISAIETEFPIAWKQGASECGVAMSELSPEETTRLQEEISREFGFILGYAQFIEANQKGTGTLRHIFVRTTYWIEGYARVVETAKAMACGDKKLIWVLHPAEHCTSCLKLAGKVKRASYWVAKDVQPKSHSKLNCRQKCRCELKETDLPLSRGPLPNLP